MQISLHAVVSHQLFDWSCRTSRPALSKKVEEIVREIGSLQQVDTTPSSPLFKAATKIYDLVRKKKNGGLGKERFVERELKTLKSYEVNLEEKVSYGVTVEGVQKTEGVQKKEGVKEAEGVKEKENRRKRKNFNQLKSEEIKRARLRNVVEIIKTDAGLEDEVFNHFKLVQEKLLRKVQIRRISSCVVLI